MSATQGTEADSIELLQGSNPGLLPDEIEASSLDSLDEFTLRMEATLDKHLDARLKTIEAQLSRLVALADGLEKACSEMMKNPMIAGVLGGGNDGFNF